MLFCRAMNEASRYKDPPYKDQRAEFFRAYFAKALQYTDYVQTGKPEHQKRWEQFETQISLTHEQKKLLSQFKRELNVLVLCATWCGDCIRQGPMFRAIELAANVISFRYLDNRENPELQEELRMNGAEKVPLLVALSEDFFELSRFGDRHLSVYRRNAEARLGPACDSGIVTPTAEVLAVELQEWIDYFERIQLMLRLSPMLRERYGD